MDRNTENRNPTGRTETTDSPWTSSTRRRLLQGVGAAGVSLTGVGTTVGTPGGGGDDEVEYTAGYRVPGGAVGQPDPSDRPELVEVRERVSRRRWERVKTAHDAARRVRTRLKNKFDLPATSAGVTRGDGGQLEVTVLRGVPAGADDSDFPVPFRDLAAAVPDEARGVVDGPGGTVERTLQVNSAKWFLSGNYADQEYRPVPGGCETQVASGLGTTAQPVWNADSDEYQLLTAGHLFDSNSDSAWQPEKSCGLLSCDSPIGSAGQYELNDNNTTIDVNGDGVDDDVLLTSVDGGTISPDSDIDTSYHLANDAGGTAEDILGHWSFDKIEMEQDAGTFITFQGRTSGRRSGDIIYTDSANGWVVCEVTSQNGDSGGPFYYANADGDVDTIGVLSAGVDYDDDGGDYDDATSFNAMSKIYDRLNLQFI